MNIKRISVVLLTFIMILINAALPVSALIYPDVEESYAEAVDIISDLGIMTGASKTKFSPNETLTRAEMVSIVMRFLNASDIKSDRQKALFSDVPLTHRAFYDIYTAYDLGIVSRSGDKFYPEDTVTFEQAVKMIVCALGYSVKAESLGGYPSGHLIVAAQNNLFRGVNVDKTDEVQRGTVAKLLYNALDAGVFERVTYGDDSSVEMKEGDNALSKYLAYNTIKGIVTQTSKTGLYASKSTIGEDKVIIGADTFNTGGTDISDYLGYRVTAYYRTEDNGEYTISFFTVDSSRNKSLKIAAGSELIADYSDGRLRIEYFEDDTAKRAVKISASINSCIYNGRSVDLAQMAHNIVPIMNALESGSITLLDNNGDNDYEVIFVSEYYSAVVRRVSTMDTRQAILCLSYTPMGSTLINTIPLYVNGRDVEYNIYDDKNKEIALGDIKQNDVVQVYSDLDNEVLDIYVSSRKVAGQITSVENDEKYMINGKTYKRDSSLPAELLWFGMQSVYYLSSEDRIVGIDSETSVSAGRYGLLMGVYVPEGQFENPQYKILTDDGEMVTYESDRKISAYNPASGTVERTEVSALICEAKVPPGYGAGYDHMLWYTNNQNNFTYETAPLQAAKQFYYRPWLTEQDKSDIASRKAVYYETNDKGHIKKIIVPDIPVSKENRLSKINPENRYSYYYLSSGRKARDISSTSAVPIVNLSQDALVFTTLALDYTEKDYGVSAGGLSAFSSGYDYKMLLYSVEGSDKARLIVASSPLPKERFDMPFVIVDSVGVRLDGSTVLYGYANGEAYKGIIKPETRLVERLLSSDRYVYNEDTKVKATNILNFRQTKPDGSAGIRAYDLSVSLSGEVLQNYPVGARAPYADETTLRRGDIILVGKDQGNEICYVEMAMRAEDCVFLPTNYYSSFANRMLGETAMTKGVITAYSIDDEVLVRSVGEYTLAGRRSTTHYPNSYNPGGLIEENTDYTLSYFYDDVNMPYNFSSCKNMWSYDYKAKQMTVINHNDLIEGDVILVRGKSLTPDECVVLRNYPNEASFEYWQQP